MTMQTENTKELTKEQMLWNRFHKAWDINSTAYHSNVVDSVNICLDFSKQELQQANKEIERLKGKTSEAAREYWQSDAIAFMNWVMDNYYKSALYVYGWHKKDEDFNIETKSYTTEELYKEFIKQEQ